MIFTRFAILFVALALISGCSVVSKAQQDVDMNAVALAWNGYHDVNKKGPDNWDQLIEFAREHDKLNQNAIIRARDDGWQMKWSLRIRDLVKPENQPVGSGQGAIGVIGTSSDGKRLCLDGKIR